MNLIVYSSRTNNTKEVAEIIAKEKDAELLEIKDKKNGLGPIDYTIGAVDSLMDKKKTNIVYEKNDLSS